MKKYYIVNIKQSKLFDNPQIDIKKSFFPHTVKCELSKSISDRLFHKKITQCFETLEEAQNFVNNFLNNI